MARPNRRRAAKALWVALGLAAVVVLVGWWFWLRPGPPQPNVVIFLLDTVRRDALGCYGNPASPTPRIDQLAKDGVRFDQVVSPSGWTLPAVASLMTGTWPTIHGAKGRGVVLTPIRDEVPTAAEVMRGEGFETVGVANAAFVSPMLGLDRGFDVFNHRYSYNWDMRRAEETIDAAIEELRKRKSRPGFYFIHLFDAHLDYNPPSGHANRFTKGRNDPAPPITMDHILGMQQGEDGREPPSEKDINYVRALYNAEMSFMDEHIGRFIDELRKYGLYDLATIVVTSDHGEEFWDHGAFEHGHTLYDELVMVPLVVKTPAASHPVLSTIARPVRLLDVMPTVFDLLDIDKPASFVGESLVPTLHGEAGRGLAALCESTLYGAQRIALRGPRYKYIMELDRTSAGPGELYDWIDDPGETRDLSDELPDIRDELRSALIQLQRGNVAVAQGMSRPNPVDLDPDRIHQLKSLGYIR